MEINYTESLLKGFEYGILISLSVGLIAKGINYAIKFLKRI